MNARSDPRTICPAACAALTAALLLAAAQSAAGQPGWVLSHQKISSTEGGFTGVLDDRDAFGASVASLGDLAVTADDDSGINGNGDDDLSNGSPNYETINAAFRKHDLATDNVAYVTISWTGSAPGDVADDVDLDISVLVNAGSLTLATTDPVKLRWRVNSGEGAGGAWTPMNMTHRELEDDYQATILASNYAVGDVIDFYVRAKVEETDKQFTCFPTQAQFDWTAPTNGIPEERDFFSVVVTDSPKTAPLSTDLHSDPTDWTRQAGQWAFGAPPLEDFGEQPGNDYPFDTDPSGMGPTGPYCFFTHATEPVDDEWDLDTKAFDLSDTDIDYAVVSYALWFYAREATVGEDKFEVQLLDKNSTWRTIQTIDVDEAGDDDTKLIRWIRQRITVTKGTDWEGEGEVEFGSAMKLRFRAIEFAATVEAVVDEVRVWGVFDE